MKESGSTLHPAEPINLEQELLKAEVFVSGWRVCEELRDLSGHDLVEGPHQAVVAGAICCNAPQLELGLRLLKPDARPGSPEGR